MRTPFRSASDAWYGLLRHVRSRSWIKAELIRLEPWYQPVRFGWGLASRPTAKTGKLGRLAALRSDDRGLAKWREFVEPSLPFSPAGRRILEVGCNAGVFLQECVRHGAREAVGIEKDDHYYGQATFVNRAFGALLGRYRPVRLYQGSMETFDYSLLGRFDLALLLLVIYHIGKSEDYSDLTPSAIRDLQVGTLRRLAEASRFQLFQANPLNDEGRGKGRDSLLELVKSAGLQVERERVYNHPRGYLLLTKSAVYSDRELFPVRRMVSKYFLRADQSAERRLVDQYVDCGQERVDVETSTYYGLRTGMLDWGHPGVARFPQDLDIAPEFWIMPWCVKRREIGERQQRARVRGFPQVLRKFYLLIDRILQEGENTAEHPIPGYRLAHPDHEDIFLYIDGNHRMGVLSHLAERSGQPDMEIHVEVRQVIERGKLLDYPLTQQLVAEGQFTEPDVFRWFDHAFEQT